MRKDLKIGILVGIGLVFAGWALFALRSETPQQRRQQQFAKESIETAEPSGPATSPQEPFPSESAAFEPVLVENEKIHIVTSGETLSSIAVQYFGTAAAWQKIMDANTGTLQSPSQLRPGMRLKIPVK